MSPCLYALAIAKYKRVMESSSTKRQEEEGDDVNIKSSSLYAIHYHGKDSAVIVMQSCSYSFLCSFMFGWHVHEKAILHVIIPLSMLLVMDTKSQVNASYAFIGRDFTILSISGIYSLLPLLFRQDEYILKVRRKVYIYIYIYIYLFHRLNLWKSHVMNSLSVSLSLYIYI